MSQRVTDRTDNKTRGPAAGIKTLLDSKTRAAFAPSVSSRNEPAMPSRWHWLGKVFTSGDRLLPPRMAFIELALFAAIIVAEWQFDIFPDLTRMNPHPYWIAVLLLSLQYGTIAGLSAAGLAIVGQVVIGMPEPDIEERHFNYLIRVWTQPVLWLLVALFLGAFRSRQIEKREYLRSQVVDLEMRGGTLVDYTSNLENRIASLERAIAVSASPTQNRLLVALHALAAAKPGRWASDLATVLDIAVPRAAVSVAVADERGLRVVLTHKWPSTTAWRTEFQISEPLAQAILGERRTLNVAERADELILVKEGVVAVPIFHPTPTSTPNVIGMLKLEDLDPELLDTATADRLTVIAKQLAPALTQGSVQLVAHDSLDAATPAPLAVDSENTNRDRVATLKRWRGFSWLAGGRGSGGGNE